MHMISEEKALFRNFIDGIEMLNQFIVDFQEIKEKTTVLDRFMEEYSKINTFRKLLESIRKIDNKIEEILKRTLASEEDFQRNLSKIAEEVKKNNW